MPRNSSNEFGPSFARTSDQVALFQGSAVLHGIAEIRINLGFNIHKADAVDEDRLKGAAVEILHQELVIVVDLDTEDLITLGQHLIEEHVEHDLRIRAGRFMQGFDTPAHLHRRRDLALPGAQQNPGHDQQPEQQRQIRAVQSH
ncbi:MAG: hypothetical protein ABW095_03890 [Candidatus Thiodiazotropha sp.]